MIGVAERVTGHRVLEADDRDDGLHPPGRASGEHGVENKADHPDEPEEREQRHERDQTPSRGASAVDHHDGSLHGSTLGSRSGARWLAGSVLGSGRIAQLARALPLQGRCRGFESLCAHHHQQRCLCPVQWLSTALFLFLRVG